MGASEELATSKPGGQSSRGRNLRAGVFVAAFLLIAFGPAYQQLLGKHCRWLRAWVMFEGYGINYCQVEFYQVHADGSREKVKWLELLGYPDARKAPANLRAIIGMGRPLEIAREVRKHVPPGTNLIMSARISGVDGWTELYNDHPIPAEAPTAP